MGFDDGQIILDSDNGAYYAGQTVYGRIVFSQNKVKTIHGIYVDIKGFCKVHWTSTRTRKVNRRRVHYTVHHDAHEEYFRRKHFIFGSDNGEHHLQEGHHEFKFDCRIPPYCPSSFEGTEGHIRYRIKVVMVTSGIFSPNKEKMIPLRVHVPVDLNQDPYCKEPLELELISSYCCWCISAGSSEVRVTMPVAGYCPGQVIPLVVTCKNESNIEIEEIKFAIKKDITYIAESEPGTCTNHDTVAEIKKGPIPSRTTRNWTVDFEVPAMDIYNFNACRFINIVYRFKVSTEVGCCHSGNDEAVPIIIGTVPLVGFQDNIQNPLHDQMPKSMEIQNVQGSNCYPPPPIINQPLPNSPYPNGNAYPSNTPYPGGNPGFPTTPVLGKNSPYPPGNQPFPNITPYPPSNSPYPPGNAPYPASSSPYSKDNSPHGTNPSPIPPYPGARQSPVPPYPNVTGTTLFNTGTPGSKASGDDDAASMPLLPMGANIPYPTNPTNPYATASAPVPSTPGTDEKIPPIDDTPTDSSNCPPYNPEFMKASDKKEEKTN